MRFSFPRITPRTAAIVAGTTAGVVLVAGGGLVAAGVFGQKVVLDLEGDRTEIRTTSATVEEFLQEQGVTLRAEDLVEPVASADLDDVETVKVRYSKPIGITFDGETTEDITHELTHRDALVDLGLEAHEDAYVSAPLDSKIPRNGSELVVSNPKELMITADGQDQSVSTTAPTVQEVFDEAGVTVGELDEVTPALDSFVTQDAALKVVRIERVTRTETAEIDFSEEIQNDDDLIVGEREVITRGEPGAEETEVELVLADGEERERTVVSRSTVREPVNQVIKVGTRQPEPTPTPTPAPAAAAAAPATSSGGSTASAGVWDQLAQCESGGNWSINTGNGYYGGLQFSAATWASVGGSGLPHQASREEQINRGQILQSRAGWGQWPSCSSKLGLR